MEITAAGLKLRLKKDLLKSTLGSSFTLSLSPISKQPNAFAALVTGGLRRKTLDGVIRGMTRLHGNCAFLAARWEDGGAAEIIQSLHPERSMSVASEIKLYILGAILKDINAGRRHWDDLLELRTDDRSYPESQMRLWPVGMRITLETATILMMSVSDNTATDLLIREVGRPQIESVVLEAGNCSADRNIPFVAMREMVRLKSNHSELGRTYCGLSAETKRAFLETTVQTMPEERVTLQGSVERIEELEWFASPNDVLRIYEYLLNHSQRGAGAQTRSILSIHPEPTWIDRSRWDFIHHKSGGEPGVLNFNYLLHSRSNGMWYLVTGTWNDAQHPLRVSTFESLLRRAIQLLP